MKKYIVTSHIEYNEKFLLPEDVLILISTDFGVINSGKVISKTFCNLSTREKITLFGRNLMKIREEIYEQQ